jgi:hypothetical protein
LGPSAACDGGGGGDGDGIDDEGMTRGVHSPISDWPTTTLDAAVAAPGAGGTIGGATPTPGGLGNTGGIAGGTAGGAVGGTTMGGAGGTTGGGGGMVGGSADAGAAMDASVPSLDAGVPTDADAGDAGDASDAGDAGDAGSDSRPPWWERLREAQQGQSW